MSQVLWRVEQLGGVWQKAGAFAIASLISLGRCVTVGLLELTALLAKQFSGAHAIIDCDNHPALLPLLKLYRIVELSKKQGSTMQPSVIDYR